MGIIANMILLMLASIVLFIGIQFFVNNKVTSNKTRYYVLGYSIFSGLWCLCYGAIGLTADFDLAEKLRAVGVFAINGFIIVEAFLLSGMNDTKKSHRIGLRVFYIVLGVIDTIVFSRENVAAFVRVRNWTTWLGSTAHTTGRTIHSHIIILYMIVMFCLGVRWYIKNPLMRQRRFIISVFIANFIMMFSTIPDTVMPLYGRYAIPTSGAGAALCTIVIWYGASILNTFDINIRNIFEQIYRFVDAGVLVFDVDYKLVLSNPFMEKFVSDDTKEKIGLADMFYVDEEQTREFFDDTAEGIVSKRFEAIADHKIYSLKNTVLMDDFNQPYGYLCALLDVTDEINMVNELEAANEAKTKFLASISHEIRTPINAILGFTEIIANLSEDEEIVSYTDNISRAGEMLLSIINDLLDMSKISSGSLTILPAEYDLSNVLSDVYLLHSVKAAEKGLSFFLENDEFIPKFLFGDSLRIQQIIANLVSNSIKYTSEGTIRLIIDYREQDDDFIDLYITVTDTGMGIHEEDIPYLFDVFTRFDEVKNKHTEGTGVGLAITKNLVDGMGGTIEVDSKYGEGTSFRIILPQKVVKRDPLGRISNLNKGQKTGSRKNMQFNAPKVKVLAVDDNPMNLMVFGGLVKLLGIKVDTATDGPAALSMIKDKKYDIIFLDHMMPGMDGIEVLERIKKDKTHVNQQTPVIVMTANCIGGAKEEYLQAGFDDYIGKPIQKDVLASTISKYIGSILIEKGMAETSQPEKGVDKESIFGISVKGVDWNRAFTNTPDYEVLLEIIRIFYGTADKEIAKLNNFFAEITEGSEEALGSYRIKVHAMKNSLALVGAGALSDDAKDLEMACKNGDVQFLKDNHESFTKEYLDLAMRLQLAVTGSVSGSKKQMTSEELLVNLDMIQTAMEEFDLNALNEMSFALEEFSFEEEAVSSYIEEIQSAIIVLDQEKILQKIAELRELIQ